MEFKKAITDCLIKNSNNVHTDNYDVVRYGSADPYHNDTVTIKSLIKKKLFKNKVTVIELNNTMQRMVNVLGPHFQMLERVYDNLADKESKELMLQLLAYRILTYRKVKLPLNNKTYFAELEKMNQLADMNDGLDSNFKHFKLYKFDLNKIGRDVKIYFTPAGILTDFIVEQYRYKTASTNLGAEPGDVVIDAGGCWGDTALYFADAVGATGKVYTYEFIPNNIKILEKNTALNPRLEKSMNLVKRPVWNKSDIKVFFKDNGPGSKISFEEFDGYDGTTTTLSIDDLCKDMDKVDFIKMDIEGAEPYALEGAKNTIIKFKPKLAIAIYHSIDDFKNIPLWILDLNLGYRIYMGHYSMNEEETVIFAVAD